MKLLNFSKSLEKSINVNIMSGNYSNFIEGYSKKYKSLIISDIKIRKLNKSFDEKNFKYLKSGYDAKYLDKYLDLCNLIKKENFYNLIAVGGSSILELTGYTYNSLDFNKKRLTFIPSTLFSSIVLPLQGEFSLDMNYEISYLRISGYPDDILIDTELFKTMDIQKFSKSFYAGYILGIMYDKNFSVLSKKYMKKNTNLDLEEYIYTTVLYIFETYKNKKNFPGMNILKHIINYSSLQKYEFVEIIASISLLLAFISRDYGYVSNEFVVKLKDTIEEFNLYKKNLILEFKENLFYNQIKEVLFLENGHKEELINNEIISKSIKTMKSFVRGEFFE